MLPAVVSASEPTGRPAPEESRALLHRLRNPAAAIAGIAELLRETVLAPDQAEMVRLIRDGANELLALLGAPAQPAAAASRPGSAAAEPVRGLRLLLAEDDPATRFLHQALLARAGHLVDAVGNGAEALARLSEAPYDAVVLDCRMPGLDGFETARRIRAGLASGASPTMPLVALTAYSGKKIVEKCLAAGMDEVLAKPLRVSEMQAALARRGLGLAPAAPPAQEDHDLILDRTHIRTMREAPGRVGGTLLDDFMELFYREEPKRITTLAELAREARFPDLVRAAHTVAGSCAMLGARELQREASALEAAAAEGSSVDVAHTLETVEVAWKRLCQALTEAGFKASKEG